ncbi:MAG: hypothetical protein DDT19_00054 [Syntrophomonadaceae bacterium]|nr:hypothetical protein [Bacillota bacterium]
MTLELKADAFEVFIQRPGGWDRLDFYIGKAQQGRYYLAKPIELVFYEVEEGATLPEPTLKLSGREGKLLLQALAKALTEHGIKIGTADITGELKATQFHLEDMRRLVFEALKGGK